MSDFSSVENDLRAIEAINQVDRQAALAGDTARMMSQWTDDFVLLQAAGRYCAGAAPSRRHSEEWRVLSRSSNMSSTFRR